MPMYWSGNYLGFVEFTEKSAILCLPSISLSLITKHIWKNWKIKIDEDIESVYSLRFKYKQNRFFKFIQLMIYVIHIMDQIHH